MNDNRFVRCKDCGALNEPRALFCSRCGASMQGLKPGEPRPRFNSTNLALGAALLLGLAILAIVLYTTVARSLDEGAEVVPYANEQGIPASLFTETTVPADPGGSETDPTSTTTTTEPPVMVRPKATVSSSALAGTATESFQATNLLDGDLGTAWIEGAKGSGTGEWVRFEFAQPTLLSRIDIANGYQKDGYRFSGNPRIKLMSLEYSSGATQLIQLRDVQELQYIVAADEAVQWVKIVIVSVYPGERGQDTALSEVHLLEKID